MDEWNRAKGDGMTLRAFSSEASPSVDQACAVPFRGEIERIEFCLITSSAGRWKFPKGVVEPGDSLVETALKEAREEAGLHGQVVGDPLGFYEIRKKGRPRNVVAWLMSVSRVDAVWQEIDARQRRWAALDEAHGLISEPALHELLEVAHALASAAWEAPSRSRATG